MDDKNMKQNDEQLEHVEQVESDAQEAQKSQIEQAPEQMSSEPVDEYKDKYLRLLAEFNNYQRQKDEELKSMAQFGTRNILLKIIDIVDDVEMGLTQESVSEETQNILDILKSKLTHIMTLEGVQEVTVEPGSEFDPSSCEVLSTIEDEANKGKVAHVVRKGYKIGDRVVRSAKVIVGK